MRHQLSPAERALVEQGLARFYRGRLIPIMKGGSDEDESLFPALPEDLSGLSVDELTTLAAEYGDTIREIAENPADFTSEDFSSAELLEATTAAVESLATVRAELASREEPEPDEGEPTAPGDEPEDEATVVDSEADFAAIAQLADTVEPEPEPVPTLEVEPPAPEPEVVPLAPEPEPAAVVAAATAPAPRPPARARRAAPAPTQPVVALTAAAAADLPLGYEYANVHEIANAMIRRRGQFGHIAPNTSGEKQSIAVANWSHLYPADRKLGRDEGENMALIASVTDPVKMKAELDRRRKGEAAGSLVASGGLCAPVAPYYNLQMLSTAQRPVRAALAAFNADRGGIRAGRPAALSAISTAIGTRTAEQDGLGGTFATKTCQVIDCPDFEETDVEIRYHCIQFGNLGARTFPELVAQWNQLVLAAHARSAESGLLTGIDTASTQVTAGSLGLGASASLFSQILAAANGVRSRNRMAPDAPLRLLLPYWAVDLIVSDVIRSQFQRFDTDEARVMALLRRFNVEPSFYIDGAAGRGQVFGAQDAGALLPFPDEVVWYLFPEGSFLYLDGGTLELGLVRDSVLNETNDFQIFGETFENVAFVGVESLAVASSTCDSGTVSAPHAVECPIDYTHSS